MILDVEYIHEQLELSYPFQGRGGGWTTYLVVSLAGALSVGRDDNVIIRIPSWDRFEFLKDQISIIFPQLGLDIIRFTPKDLRVNYTEDNGFVTYQTRCHFAIPHTPIHGCSIIYELE